jgi:hypothetical protein
MSVFNYITQSFNVAHATLDTMLQDSFAAEMASISALHDHGPSTWCVTSPPITPQISLDNACYTAQANLEVERLTGQRPGDQILRYCGIK